MTPARAFRFAARLAAIALPLRAAPRAPRRSPWGDDPLRGAADRRRASERRRRLARRHRDQARSPAGTPIGAIPAIPACRRASTFPAPTMSKRVKVLYPAPQRSPTRPAPPSATTTDVIFPLRVVPQNARQAGRRCGSRSITRCARSCACRPKASAELTLPGDAAPIDAALDRRRGARAEAGRARPTPGLTGTPRQRRTPSRWSWSICRADRRRCRSFVEGPTPEWALPIPKPAPARRPGHQRFAFELDGLPPGVDPRARRAHLHGRRRQRSRSRSRPVSTRQAWPALTSRRSGEFDNAINARGHPCPSRSATSCPTPHSA